MSIMQTSDGTTAASRGILLGVTTPLSDVVLPLTASGSVLAIVSTHFGTLSADTAPGASVRGGGSSMLWISGSVAQVNAKLATLTYATSTPGTDQLTVTLLDAHGSLSTAVQAPLSILPLEATSAGATASVIIDQGTITLDARRVDGPVIALSEPAGSQIATTAILVNTTIGTHSTLSFRNDNATGLMPRLAVAGHVELDGASSFAGNGTIVSLAQGAMLSNEGTMSITPGAAQFTGAGTLINDGTIRLTGDGTGSSVRIATQLGGTGLIALSGGASLSLDSAVAATETVSLGLGTNTLHLSQPATFAGTIAGFSVGDAIELDRLSITSAVYSGTGADTGTLALFNGQATVATLRFTATEPGSVFQFTADSSGSTTVTLAPPASTTATPEANVYRFFDATHGTQLLTQDTAERDAILGTRPDLHYEGVAFKAIQPQQVGTSAVAVYRFFDTTNGTHFLTASATERDTLLGSRADLVFEPGSTMFEHATAQAGDVAVYRFFDQMSGAHFFTSDSSERASILANRPDMTIEGIAFYAPGA